MSLSSGSALEESVGTCAGGGVETLAYGIESAEPRQSHVPAKVIPMYNRVDTYLLRQVCQTAE